MLDYLLRTLPLALRAKARPGGDLVSRLPRRVSLRQIDLNRHMNQAQYPAMMELGRTDLLFGSGAWDTWRRAGINPVVAEQRIVYRRELAPLQRYVIDSRVVGVEGRLALMEHHLLVGDRVHTSGFVKVIFVGPDGVLSPERTEQVVRPWVTDALRVENWTVVG